MIYLYSGTPGSGKSMHAARLVLDYLGRRRPVIANFDINPATRRKDELFTYKPNGHLTPISSMTSPVTTGRAAGFARTVSCLCSTRRSSYLTREAGTRPPQVPRAWTG